MFSLAINSYSPTSKSGYVSLPPDRISTLSLIRTKVFQVPHSKCLFKRQVVIEDRIFKDLHSPLQLRPSRNYFSERLAKTFVIPNKQNQYIHENIFNNALGRRLAIAMNNNTAFTGSLKFNPFLYQKFDLRSIWIVRGSHVVVDMDTTDDVQSYITTMRALKFDEDGPGIPQ